MTRGTQPSFILLRFQDTENWHLIRLDLGQEQLSAFRGRLCHGVTTSTSLHLVAQPRLALWSWVASDGPRMLNDMSLHFIPASRWSVCRAARRRVERARNGE
jgi:hypothetical protein